MQIKLWGTRGSLPTPQSPKNIKESIRYLFQDFFASGYKEASDVETYLSKQPACRFGGFGGDTMCVEVKTDRQQLIVDAGSGLRSLGYELMSGPCGCGDGDLHLLFTHFHWDHLFGLPFFVPMFIPGNKIHVYAVQPELTDIFHTIFRKPYFPLSIEQLDATIEYHVLEPRKPVVFGDITVTPYELDHPDPCWGYKFESNGKVFSHCVDSEIKRITRKALGPDLPLYQGVDLMVMDAQYTLIESMEKIDWGHGSAALGLEIAMREGIKQVLFVHHDPAATDAKVEKAERETRIVYENQLKMASHSGTALHQVKWSFVGDGTVVQL